MYHLYNIISTTQYIIINIILYIQYTVLHNIIINMSILILYYNLPII